jgi:hypothetical protein
MPTARTDSCPFRPFASPYPPFAETSPHQFPRPGLRLETWKILLAYRRSLVSFISHRSAVLHFRCINITSEPYSGANSAPTRIRRDQRDFSFTSQAWRSPHFPCDHACSASQKPRSSQAAIQVAASAAGFRPRLGGGVALRLRSRRLSACAPLFPPPPADRSHSRKI